MNDQERFWADPYARDYIAKNSGFDSALGVEAWPIDSIPECGCRHEFDTAGFDHTNWWLFRKR